MKIESKLKIERPRDLVFDFVFNPDNFEFWMSNFESRKELTDRPGTLGSTAQHIQKVNGKQITFIEKIIDLKPSDEFSVELVNKDIEIIATYSFLEEDGDCILIIKEQFRLKSFFFNSIKLIVKQMMESRLKKDATALKSFLEIS